MEIICLTVGDLATNCYLVTDEETTETVIIDPGDEGDFISTTLLERKLTPKAIILTHGHYDHCLAALELKLNFNLPIYLHPKDLFLYEKAHLSSAYWSPISLVKGRNPATGGERDFKPRLPPVDHFLLDKEIIPFGNSSLQVIHTPGHTPGSICLRTVIARPAMAGRGNLTPPDTPSLFTGDTLFASGIGSTDHTYSSRADLKRSLSKLSSETCPSGRRVCDLKSVLIYPGHEDFAVKFN